MGDVAHGWRAWKITSFIKETAHHSQAWMKVKGWVWKGQMGQPSPPMDWPGGSLLKIVPLDWSQGNMSLRAGYTLDRSSSTHGHHTKTHSQSHSQPSSLNRVQVILDKECVWNILEGKSVSLVWFFREEGQALGFRWVDSSAQVFRRIPTG